MLKHYFTVALRLIKRSWLFSSINMLGFVFGMAAAFLIYLWVVDELTFEDFHQDADRIFRVVEVKRSKGGEITESASTIGAMAGVFRKKFPQVEEATLLKFENENTLENGSKKIAGKFVYADTAFFDVFTFPVIDGNPKDMKEKPNAIVITDKMARKLFGHTNVSGKKLELNIFDDRTILDIAGVIKIPRKSHIQFDALFSSAMYGGGSGRSLDTDNSFRERIAVYIKIREGSLMNMEERKAMSHALADVEGSQTLLRFQPIKDIHLKTYFKDDTPNLGTMEPIYLFIALAALIIFMGAFNFTTLSTARASLRYKEIGVRKVTGAKRKMLVVQFLSESVVQAVISLVLALAFTELMLPFFNRMMDKDITLGLNGVVLGYVIFGIVGVGCLAGSYPAFYLSSVNPLLAFKGGMKTGKKGRFIRGLVCVQFVIAITLILATSIVYKQLNYMQNKDLGVEKENIISIWCNLWYEVGEFKQEVLKNPNVKSVAMGTEIDDYMHGKMNDKSLASISWYDEEAHKERSLKMAMIFADRDFINTFGIKLLKGKPIEFNFDDYWETDEHPILINETAWKAMGVADPVGMLLTETMGNEMHEFSSKKRIVGVVKDFNFQSLREKIRPAYLVYSPEALTCLHIRIAPEHKQQTLKFLQQKYEEMAPTLFVKEFRYQFFSDALNKNYAREQQQSRMLLFFTVLAVIIAMMGVFGLVALSTEQRTKEIGIRKVNGAHSDRIVRMFCMEYLKWVGIAFIIACPLGYVFMHRWLSDFAYQTTISWWLFPLAGVIIAAITLLTVWGQTWRTASQNPVKSLRYE